MSIEGDYELERRYLLTAIRENTRESQRIADAFEKAVRASERERIEKAVGYSDNLYEARRA